MKMCKLWPVVPDSVRIDTVLRSDHRRSVVGGTRYSDRVTYVLPATRHKNRHCSPVERGEVHHVQVGTGVLSYQDPVYKHDVGWSSSFQASDQIEGAHDSTVLTTRT
jgi:hypothetical protein